MEYQGRMRVFALRLLPVLWILSIASCRAGEPLQIVVQGKSEYRIVLPDKMAANEQKAASVLQEYIRRITGATLPIVKESSYPDGKAILIGKTRKMPAIQDGQISHDGFYIATDAANLYIRGASGKGVLYGVYTFLEQYLGCRKFAGGVPATIPQTPHISIPSGVRNVQSPRFVFRQSYYPASNDPEYLDWHKLHRFEDLWGLWGHSYFKLVSPEKYFATHPEYFSLVQGRRQASQLCLSNEDVFRLSVDYLRAAMQKRPDAIYWSVSPNDEAGCCTCEACSKTDAEEGGPQGSLICFVNRIAAVFPDQQFTTLAYTYTARPPRKTKPASNVHVFLSSIDAYRTAPLSQEPSAETFRKNLEGWKRITDRIFIWDYTTQFTNFLTPFPDYLHTQENFRYFRNNDITGVFLHGSEETYGDMAELNSYLQAKLLWNPDADAQQITSEFLSGYYGAAGDAIKQYIEVLDEGIKTTGARLDIYGNPVNNHSDYLSPALIERYSDILDRAEAAIAERPELGSRVARVRLSLEYVVLQQSVFYGADQHGYMARDEAGNYHIRAPWRERVAQFVAQCTAAGVTELAEGGLSPEAYRKEWDIRFARPWKQNLAAEAAIHLSHPFSSEYPARGVQSLTDGVAGGNDYSANWLLFYGHDLTATLDMHVKSTVRSVTGSFLYDPRHYIFLPREIKLELSDDGVQYRTVGSQFTLPAIEDMEVNIRKYLFRLPEGTAARYVRVTATCPESLPAWRQHATKKPAVACDEILVE